MNNLYVGGLPFAVTDSDLALRFIEFGAIEHADVIRHHVSGKSRGFGFVRFSNAESAAAALAAMNGSRWGGRKIDVRFALEKPQPLFKY